MRRFIHRDLGSVMYVADDRLEEYLLAGHSLAESEDTDVIQEEKETLQKRSRKTKRAAKMQQE